MSRPDFIEWTPKARELAMQRVLCGWGSPRTIKMASEAVQLETLRIEIKRAELSLEFELLSKAPRW